MGRFELLGVPAGEYDLYAISGTRTALRVDVQLADGDARDVRLVVAEAAIRGRVVDAAGVPLPRSPVTASATGRDHIASHAFDRTGADGC